jgi:hypothetical protein
MDSLEYEKRNAAGTAHETVGQPGTHIPTMAKTTNSKPRPTYSRLLVGLLATQYRSTIASIDSNRSTMNLSPRNPSIRLRIYVPSLIRQEHLPSFEGEGCELARLTIQFDWPFSSQGLVRAWKHSSTTNRAKLAFIEQHLSFRIMQTPQAYTKHNRTT